MANKLKAVTGVYLAVAAVAFTALGVNGLLNPVNAIAAVGLRTDGVDGLNEARATYGGLHLALAVFIAAGLRLRQARNASISAVIAICGGLATGRIGSVIADGLPNANMVGWLALEVVAALIGGLLLWRSNRDRSRSGS